MTENNEYHQYWLTPGITTSAFEINNLRQYFSHLLQYFSIPVFQIFTGSILLQYFSILLQYCSILLQYCSIDTSVF